jgi:hypothetical protein
MNPAAVQAAAAARLGLDLCQGWITEPAHTDAAARIRPASRRRCGRPLDPVLSLAGFQTHPCCDPAEVSATCPPMAWPDEMLSSGRRLIT